MNVKTIFFLLLCCVAGAPRSLLAQVKQVLYVNQSGVNSGRQGISVAGNDPVIRMLNADKNFQVTYVETPQDGSKLPALTDFDLIIAQESIASAATLFQSSGKLAVREVSVPIIYSKTSAFRDGRAVQDADAVAIGTQRLELTVPQANQAHDLFRGIDFSAGEQVRVTYELANNDGTEPGDKAIDIVNHLDISTSGTLLATVPEVTDPAQALVVNYLPAGTQLGEDPADVLQVDAVVLPFAYGALVREDGKNITDEGLTLWRNAAYLLTGLAVPPVKYYNPALAKKILYVNQTGVDPGDGGGATPGYDPVIRMLELDDYFEVTYVETPPDGSLIPDLAAFDLVIAQETIDPGADYLQPGGLLGVKNVSIPVIFNQIGAFTDGRAVTDVDAAVTPTQNFFITVPAAHQSHVLFNGIDFAGGEQLRITYELAADDGSDGGNKALDIVNHLDISTSGTLLATVPEVTDPAQALVVNYLPAGTQLGEDPADVLQVDAVNFSFSYGAMVRDKGKNISSEALTLWRNAVYLLTGLPVPTDLYRNPANYKQVLYINQFGVDPGNGGGSTPGNDPVIRMLNADENFQVTYVETPQDGSKLPDPQFFDLIIAQETLSSGAPLFQPGGSVGIRNIKTPIIYNKTNIFRDGRAVTDADAVAATTQHFYLTVPQVNQRHDLFRGIDFSAGEQVRMIAELAANDGSDGGDKALDIVNHLDISTSGTLLATVPEVTDPDQALVVNYLPAGTQLGADPADVLQVDAVVLPFAYGALVKGDGANVSSEALTIWRNAAYLLTRLPVPEELYINADYTPDITSVDPFESVDIRFSPNPTHDRVQLTVGGSNERTAIALYNLRGQQLWYHTLVTGPHRGVSVDMSRYSEGIYLLQVVRGRQRRSFKIVKQ
ncbi:Por secretion system C-terminal sorting domain-containing protein [Catalinimonas alkaloidigena]|uniref:Por secretion system C-terminal sorting domain-containing protein n=1 Tax=Catalinimonas alkaloidigena TaxID=1075417 RepID=A0A1G9TQ78_9BACT|nr:T9SS type A sorting domain-containing protein [Catalinimonas alkaloidigena]SDM49811.1 Por secretion system C-terminal sorting domain-containing protein [Catalinimonas alkaloidigena]